MRRSLLMGIVATLLSAQMLLAQGFGIFMLYGPAQSKWDPADKTASITLSNNNLTATSGAASSGGVRATFCKTTGKYYVEFGSGENFTGGGVGITTSTQVIADIGGTGVNSFLVKQGFLPKVYLNTVQVVELNGTFTNLTIVGMAVDLDANLGWFRNAAGDWNNDVAANPTTGIGGVDISSVFSAVSACLVYWTDKNGDSMNLAPGPTYNFTPPSGYNRWAEP